MKTVSTFRTLTMGLVLFLCLGANAQAAEVEGAACSTIGTTTITADKTAIIACLYSTAEASSDEKCAKSGSCVWKSMAGKDSVPTGTVAFFVLAGCPTGWAMTDGSNGTLDLRGEFLRVWDAGRGLDNGRTLGTSQGDAIRNITGVFGYDDQFAWNGYSGAFVDNGSAPYGASNINREYGSSVKFDASRVVPTANENRPHNVALIACQKL